MNRRTLSAALQTSSVTEQALDFVKGNSVKPTADSAGNAVTSAHLEDNEEPMQTEPELRSRLRFSAEPKEETEAGLISLTVRVPRIVPPGLLLASVDRKLKRQRPWTQQEIVAEALTGWLRKHGYLS